MRPEQVRASSQPTAAAGVSLPCSTGSEPIACRPMSGVRVPGSYRFANQPRSFEAAGDPRRFDGRQRRVRRILASIQKDVDEGGTARVRQILRTPQELYRIEVERPDMSYLRTTVLGREALTALLEETPENLIRERFIFRSPA